MKSILVIIIAQFVVCHANAQGRQRIEVVERTYLLSHTVFGSKDSSTLDHLFARYLSYGHSKGKVEDRKEALTGIYNNRSVYSDTAITNLQVIMQGNTAIVRHRFSAREHKNDGTVSQLNLALMLVWVRENRQWKLMGRQALALQ